MSIHNPFDEDDEFEDDTTEYLLEDILLDVYGISRPTKYVATTKTPKKLLY